MKTRIAACVVLGLAACTLDGCASRPAGGERRADGRAGGSPESRAADTLDQLHDLASRADGEKYFALFAEEAVFLGTDATERWTKAQFRAYATPYFDQGRGWTYHARPGGRFITVAADGSTAWFDEVLDNARMGECRGSGVLVLRGGEWKIAQYNLTVPVPNDLMDTVTAMIRERAGKR